MRIGVIGAGPVGIYFAKLCLDKGHKVSLVEVGGRDQESLQLNRQSYIFQSPSLMPSGVHAVGGGSRLWRGRVSEFTAEDFHKQLKNLDFSWPFEKKELDQHYISLYRFLNAGAKSDSEIIDELKNKLGYSLPSNFALRSFRYCEPSTFLNLFELITNDQSLELLERHFAHSVSFDKEKKTPCVLLLDEDGNTSSREFDKIVIACGTLQSTALLMRSSNILPESSTKTLGAYLMEHIEGYIGTISAKRKSEKFFFRAIGLNEHNRSSNEFHGRGFAISLRSIEKTSEINVQYEFRKQIPRFSWLTGTGRWRLHFLGDRPKMSKVLVFGENVLSYIVSRVQKIFYRMFGVEKYGIYIKSEEVPFHESKIEIDNNDDTRIHYMHKISEETYDLLMSNILDFQKEFKRFFHARIFINKQILDKETLKYSFGPNWHPMGSAKMGVNPASSVCNSDLQIHGLEGIFLLSAAVFPYGSNSNPTFTSLALASRLCSSKHF